MRPPVVKRQPPPRSGFLAFFPLGWSRRSRHPVSCADCISTGRRRQHVAAPHTYCGALAVEMTSAEKRPDGPLRPSNIAVPSYRPTQQGGGTFAVRQFASGAGEGPHTSSWCDHRRMSRSRRGCPINRRGLRGDGLCAPRRSRTQRDKHGRALFSGSPRARPVRRQAPPLRSLCLEKSVHIEGLWAF